MGRTLWAFGDSFTRGDGCLIYNEYREKYPPSPKDKIWVDHVADYYNMNCNNYGEGGIGNAEIINNLVKHFDYFNPGDLVIIGSSDPTRFPVINPGTGTIGSFHAYSLEHGGPKKGLKNFYTRKALEAMVDYGVEVRLPFANQWLNYYEKHMKFLVAACRLKKVNAFMWSKVVWGNYEIIKDATEGRIHDFHWTWDSHRKFAEVMIKDIGSLPENPQQKML